MPHQVSSLIKKGVIQGCLLNCLDEHLPPNAKQAIQDGRAIASKRKKPVSEQHLLLVLSQDCDINNPRDHFIEALPIKRLPEKQVAPEQQNNRNYRKLQLHFDGIFWQLEVDLISIIRKDCIENHRDLLVEGRLDEKSQNIVIDWRVSRYNRKPFPDKFNQDFLTKYVNNKNYNLGAYLEQNNQNILDLFIYVDPKDDEQADEYKVSITALISEDCSGELEEEIRSTLWEHCQTLHDLPNSLRMSQIDTSYAPNDIRIPQDIVLRPSDFTLLDAEFLRRITMDYLCYS